MPLRHFAHGSADKFGRPLKKRCALNAPHNGTFKRTEFKKSLKKWCALSAPHFGTLQARSRGLRNAPSNKRTQSDGATPSEARISKMQLPLENNLPGSTNFLTILQKFRVRSLQFLSPICCFLTAFRQIFMTGFAKIQMRPSTNICFKT